jgi:hypothetical protein
MSDDAKQAKDPKSTENREQRSAQEEQPGLYWAVGPQPRRVRR